MGDDLYNAALKNLTQNTPLNLTVTPEQVAQGIYSFIGINKVVTGETMLMDGGHHLII
jgi:3-oxoacyl-[acyl-carrier protein] reductase